MFKNYHYESNRMNSSLIEQCIPIAQDTHSHNIINGLNQAETKVTYYTVSQKTTLMLHTNFNAHQPILIIFSRHVTGRISYQLVVCYPTI